MLRLAAATARRSAAARPARFLAVPPSGPNAAPKSTAPGLPSKNAVATAPVDKKELKLSSRQLFAALGLRTFSREELRRRFDASDADKDGFMTARDAADLICASDVEADRLAAARAVLRRLDKDEDGRVSWEEFESTIIEEASRRDRRIWPLAGTMFLGGLSVGAVMPIMPILVRDLGLGPADYGLMIGAFGAAKLVGNVPAAALVESLGRRPLIAGGLLMIAGGFGATAFAGGTAGLADARALTGLGVAGLVTGSSMAAADLSTPLSRAATQAPLGASFNAGTIMGPALGGALASLVGPSFTFAAVGGFVALDALVARLTLAETRGLGSLEDVEPPAVSPSMIVTRLRRSLHSSPELRRLCIANYAYWATLAGASMTVLPLVLVTDLGLGPGQIGALFAGQACISVAGAVPVAALADRYGPSTMIPPALLVTAVAFGALPWAAQTGYEAVAGAMALQACGSCLLGSAPSAAAVNAVPDRDRSSALAALRICGDVGLLTGSAALGGLAAAFGTDAAFGAASLVLVASAVRFRLAAPV